MLPNKRLTLDRTPPPRKNCLVPTVKSTEVENLWSEDPRPLGLLCGLAWVPFLLQGKVHTQIECAPEPQDLDMAPSMRAF